MPARPLWVGDGRNEGRVFMNLAAVGEEESRIRRTEVEEERKRQGVLLRQWRKEFFEEVVRLTAEKNGDDVPWWSRWFGRHERI